MRANTRVYARIVIELDLIIDYVSPMFCTILLHMCRQRLETSFTFYLSNMAQKEALQQSFFYLFTYCLRQAFTPWLSGMGHYMSHSSHHSGLLRINKLWLIHRMSSNLGAKQTSPIPSTAGQADNRRVSKLSKLWASTTERKRCIRRQNVYFYRSSRDLHNKWFN